MPFCWRFVNLVPNGFSSPQKDIALQTDTPASVAGLRIHHDIKENRINAAMVHQIASEITWLHHWRIKILGPSCVAVWWYNAGSVPAFRLLNLAHRGTLIHDDAQPLCVCYRKCVTPPQRQFLLMYCLL